MSNEYKSTLPGFEKVTFKVRQFGEDRGRGESWLVELVIEGCPRPRPLTFFSHDLKFSYDMAVAEAIWLLAPSRVLESNSSARLRLYETVLSTYAKTGQSFNYGHEFFT